MYDLCMIFVDTYMTEMVGTQIVMNESCRYV